MEDYASNSNGLVPPSDNSNGLVPSSSSNLGGTGHPNGLLVGMEQAHLEEEWQSADAALVATLSPEHRRMLLHESRISREVVEARGYRSVDRKAELKKLGFSDSQCNVPGLLMPLWGPTGEIVNYQCRPDQPRIKDGKSIKYETPGRSRMALDVHPFARKKLGDPHTPLFVTEGIKKGDALVSRGLCAVSLLGVWNFRGANRHGGKVALPEWEYVALNDRQVYVVFDSDVLLKPQVHAALSRLKAFLEAR